MVVVDVLLVCNLILFAYCALRSPRARSSRLDQLLHRVDGTDGEAVGREMGKVLRFPGVDELAIRRARAVHPSRHPADLSSRPMSHPSGHSSHPSGRLG
ncbi:MAG TPA: hypothetical protein VK428_02745 [Acidimicrobiales bacterium]|nr:hypothetical protein [Acidimicrobiales bacterium]